MTKVRYSYLPQQFSHPDEIFEELNQLVSSGDFTLGDPVAKFESRFADLIGVKHAVGVGSGTDALKLAMRGLGLGSGDEVITAANTFVATVGAINEIGCRIILVDCDDSFCIDPSAIEEAISPRTRAIVPVHLTGDVANMPMIMEIAVRHNLMVIEDACQGILASFDGRQAGTWGMAAGFSLHPLKNLNVWGDGGIVVTDDADLDKSLRLLRNHGLRNRNEIEVLGYNSRLDSVQAVVGNWLIDQTESITATRIDNARYYDRAFKGIPQIKVPIRRENVKHVYHLYEVFAENRDELLRHCLNEGIEAKVHYPIPLYQQDGLKFLGHAPGDFPVTDRHAASVISFPVDQHLSRMEQDTVINAVENFYG